MCHLHSRVSSLTKKISFANQLFNRSCYIYSVSETYLFTPPVNTKAAEVLYSTVANWSCVSEKTVLLDVCCGTGTIGLTMAKVNLLTAILQ